MNSSFSYKLLQRLLLALLFFSALPSVASYSGILGFLPPSSYYVFVFFRELILLFLFLLVIYRFIVFIKSRRSFSHLGIFSVAIYLLLLVFISFLIGTFGFLVTLSGLRLFTLSVIPFIIILFNSNEHNHNYKLNIFIILFYMTLSALAFFIGFELFPPLYGVTSFGSRFPFIYEKPIPASLAFASFSCFFLFYQSITNRHKYVFWFIQLVLLFFVLLTGGRSGITISLLASIASLLLLTQPKLYSIIFAPRLYKNRLLSAVFAAFVLLSLFLFSSNPSISGRASTAYQIANDGIIGGSFASRIQIFERALSNTSFFDLVFGSPGLGSNVSTQFNLIPIDFMNPDSFVTSSFLSFGFMGLVVFVILAHIFLKYSLSLLPFLAFMVFSLTTSLPENILPWSQLCLILTYSKSVR